MRGVLISSLALGALAGAACAMQALPSRSPQRDTAASPASGLNPANTADRVLQAFDAAHPQCQLWTNWQKMCSRTGPDGATVCVIDPDRPVRPSEPFCTGGPWSADEPATRAQLASYGRFCRVRRAQVTAPFRVCEGGEDRPFNGRRIAARLHPWCQLWVDEDRNHVCQTGSMNLPNVPRCEALARRGAEARSRLSCTSRAMPPWCRQPALLGDGPQYPYTGVWLPLGHIRQDPTVGGTYCDRR
jgi:hypothetical protein